MSKSQTFYLLIVSEPETDWLWRVNTPALFLWGLFCNDCLFRNEFRWLLHQRIGISNLHELQKYSQSVQSLETVWK